MERHRDALQAEAERPRARVARASRSHVRVRRRAEDAAAEDLGPRAGHVAQQPAHQFVLRLDKNLVEFLSHHPTLPTLTPNHLVGS